MHDTQASHGHQPVESEGPVVVASEDLLGISGGQRIDDSHDRGPGSCSLISDAMFSPPANKASLMARMDPMDTKLLEPQGWSW